MSDKIRYSKLSMFLCALLILPVVFVLCACDLFGSKTVDQLDVDATCNTDGTYVSSTKESYDTAMDEITKFENDAYRLSLKIEANVTANGNTVNAQQKANYNAILTNGKLAFKVTDDFVTNVADESYKNVSTIFYKDGVVYSNDNGEKTFYSYNNGNLLENVVYLNQIYLVEQVLAIVNNGENITYEKNGNKYKLTITNVNNFTMGYENDQVTNRPAFVWINLTDEGKLESLKLSTQMTFSYTYKGNVMSGTMKINVVMSAFDGQIEFPDPIEYNS